MKLRNLLLLAALIAVIFYFCHPPEMQRVVERLTRRAVAKPARVFTLRDLIDPLYARIFGHDDVSGAQIMAATSDVGRARNVIAQCVPTPATASAQRICDLFDRAIVCTRAGIYRNRGSRAAPRDDGSLSSKDAFFVNVIEGDWRSELGPLRAQAMHERDTLGQLEGSGSALTAQGSARYLFAAGKK